MEIEEKTCPPPSPTAEERSAKAFAYDCGLTAILANGICFPLPPLSASNN